MALINLPGFSWALEPSRPPLLEGVMLDPDALTSNIELKFLLPLVLY
jgi:hypothetical protein